jgi:hypothetical protein
MGERALRASHTEQKFASAALSSNMSLELAGSKAFFGTESGEFICWQSADQLGPHRDDVN